MGERARWSRHLDMIGHAAVVISLIYVGVQVRQNTAAIQTSTSQEVYQQNQDVGLLVMESAEMAAILLQAVEAEVPQRLWSISSELRSWTRPTLRSP